MEEKNQGYWCPWEIKERTCVMHSREPHFLAVISKGPFYYLRKK